jgi:hypothetical protein
VRTDRNCKQTNEVANDASKHTKRQTDRNRTRGRAVQRNSKNRISGFAQSWDVEKLWIGHEIQVRLGRTREVFEQRAVMKKARPGQDGQARPYRSTRGLDHLSNATTSLANLKAKPQKAVQHGLFAPKAGRR